MKLSIFLSLIWIMPFVALGQHPTDASIIINGVVVENNNHQPLAYVSVGIINKSKGTVSDTLGKFAFSITNDNSLDTLQFSLVGYSNFRIAIKDFLSKENKTIKLSANVTQLEEVIVQQSNSTTNSEIIGRQASGKLTQISIHNKTSVDETVGSEMGMLYKTNRQHAILRDFNFYISANNFNYIKFRINVYSLKNGLPDSLINKKQILSTLDNFRTGWTKIDLEQYNISIKKEFLITIQWVESKMEKKENPITIVPFAVTPFSKNCFVRVASQDRWLKKGMSLSNFVTIGF